MEIHEEVFYIEKEILNFFNAMSHLIYIEGYLS